MSETTARKQGSKPFVVSVPQALHEKLKIKAAAEGRFLQRIVVEKLWELFPEDAPPKDKWAEVVK